MRGVTVMMSAVSSSENEVCRVQEEVKLHQPTLVDLWRKLTGIYV
jgi:hypothetical protein